MENGTNPALSLIFSKPDISEASSTKLL